MKVYRPGRTFRTPSVTGQDAGYRRLFNFLEGIPVKLNKVHRRGALTELGVIRKFTSICTFTMTFTEGLSA